MRHNGDGHLEVTSKCLSRQNSINLSVNPHSHLHAFDAKYSPTEVHDQ